MKSLFYVEDDFVAGLLKQYFKGTGNSTRLFKRQTRSTQIPRICFSHNRKIPTSCRELLDSVRRQPRKIPTLVLTSHSDRIPEKYKSFAHFVSLPELLESNFRWHIRLARTTMRLVEEVKTHFESAESVLILLQDDPDPDAIASGLALRQVLGRNKQTAPLGSFGRVTRPENIAMVKLLEIEIEKVTKDID